MDTTDSKELRYRKLAHPRWDEVASRCLICANGARFVNKLEPRITRIITNCTSTC